MKVNKDAAPWDEVVIAGDVMLQLLNTPTPSISDRSWIDKCAYSQALPHKEELIDAYHIIYSEAFPGVGENDRYFYFPPRFPIEANGIRSVDIEYQNEIDLLIRFYLDYFNVPYHFVESESIQDRHFEIEQVLFGKL